MWRADREVARRPNAQLVEKIMADRARLESLRPYAGHQSRQEDKHRKRTQDGKQHF